MVKYVDPVSHHRTYTNNGSEDTEDSEARPPNHVQWWELCVCLGIGNLYCLGVRDSFRHGDECATFSAMRGHLG